MKSKYANTFAKLSLPLCIAFGSTASASMITLEFDLINFAEYQYSIFDDGGNKIGSNNLVHEKVQDIHGETVTITFDSSYPNFNHSEIQSNEDWYNFHRKKTEIVEFSSDSSLGIEDRLRKNVTSPNAELSQLGYFAQSYTDYIEPSEPDYSFSLGYFSDEFIDRIYSSYEEISNSITERRVETSAFRELLSFDFVEEFDSIEDINYFSVDSLLNEFYTNGGTYFLQQYDVSYTDIIDFADQSNNYTRYESISGEFYEGDLSLKSINGLAAEQYFATVPEPSTLAVFTLGIIGFFGRRLKK